MRPLLAVLLLGATATAVRDVKPLFATAPVTDDPDDPAVWVNPDQPERSWILGTNKVKAPNGALVVFDLAGKIHQTIAGIDRPNNVDVEYGFAWGQNRVDIAVVTERLKNRLRVFAVDGKGVRDLGALDCCPEPMGVGLYRRPKDGAIFAIVSPKGRPDSPRQDYLYQYRLTAANGSVTGRLVRRFGQFSGSKEIEAVAVDDELGIVYYSDEGAGIRKYHADPDHPDAPRELAMLATEAMTGDREGLALYRQPGGKGFLIATNQLPGNSEYHVFSREGGNRKLFVFRGGADTTDGIEAVSASLGSRFPKGLFVAMNSGAKNFLVYDGRAIFGGARVRP